METNETNNEEVTIEDPKAVLSALERAKGDAKKFREEKEILTQELQSKDELIAKYTQNLLNQKIIKKIEDEGIGNADRLLKFIDFNAISLDEDFNVIGFDDQIESLKDTLPEVFDPKLRVGGQADAAISASVSTRYSASEMQAAKILGKL